MRRTGQPVQLHFRCPHQLLTDLWILDINHPTLHLDQKRCPHDNSPRLASESVAVPADYQDPNHPHYPGDLEYQSTIYRPILSKKSLWITGGVLTTSMFIVAAVLWGVALIRNHKNVGVEAQETIIPTTTATPVSLEIQTVFENATTFVYTTTRLPLIVAPSLAISTITVLPTTRAKIAPEPPLRPTQVEPSSAISSSQTPSPTNVKTGGALQSAKCLFDGAWVLKEQCEKYCQVWPGHTTHCEVSKRSQWVCVSCPT